MPPDIITYPDWMIYTIQAIGSMCSDILDVMVDVAPVALPVGGAYLAIRYGWRTAKGLTR